MVKQSIYSVKAITEKLFLSPICIITIIRVPVKASKLQLIMFFKHDKIIA